MMIFYIAAARSVGIAARQAWTPYWPKMDNNHAWVEIWDGENWAFLGAAEPAAALNEAWFKNTVKSAALVFSSAFGVPEDAEEIYRKESNYAIINSTRNYVEYPAKLVITLLNERKEKLKRMSLYIYLFNFGGLRPVARLVTDTKGQANITINQGDYFISAGLKDSRYFQKITIDSSESRVEIVLQKSRLISGSFWLNYK